MEALSKELADKAMEAIELAKSTGKIKKGTNEVTKVIERGQAKFVVVASDVNPAEIVMHLPLLSKEKGIFCVTAGSREELGAAAGLEVGTVSVAVVEEGEAKQTIKELLTELNEPEAPAPVKEKKEEASPETTEDKPVEKKEEPEAPKEEAKEEPEAPKEEAKEEPEAPKEEAKEEPSAETKEETKEEADAEKPAEKKE